MCMYMYHSYAHDSLLSVRSLPMRLFATPVGVTDRCKTRRCSAIDGQRLAFASPDWRFPIGSFAIGSFSIGGSATRGVLPDSTAFLST